MIGAAHNRADMQLLKTFALFCSYRRGGNPAGCYVANLWLRKVDRLAAGPGRSQPGRIRLPSDVAPDGRGARVRRVWGRLRCRGDRVAVGRRQGPADGDGLGRRQRLPHGYGDHHAWISFVIDLELCD